MIINNGQYRSRDYGHTSRKQTKHNTTQTTIKISNTDPTKIRGEPIRDDVRCYPSVPPQMKKHITNMLF